MDAFPPNSGKEKLMPDEKKDEKGGAPTSTLLTPEEKRAREEKLSGEATQEPEKRTLVLDGMRDPRNAPLRAAVAIVQEDAQELVIQKLGLVPGGQAAIDFRGIAELIAILGPLIASIFQKAAPKPAPVPEPVPEPPPGVQPPPGPKPVEVVVHKIVGGFANCTGITEGGPLGKRVDRERFKQILAGEANAPHDSRFEFDFTPIFEDGHRGEPSGPGEPPDPYFQGTPDAPKAAGDTDGPMQKVRLRFDWEGPEGSSADLSREWVNNGCTPRVRVKTGGSEGGLLSNLRFEFEGGATPVAGVDEIHVGRGA